MEAVVGSTAVKINAINFDSRKVKSKDVFVAVKGTISDGHQFIETAVNQGAVAVICEEIPSVKVEGVTYVKVENAQTALAFMAANFYNNPSENLKLVGITGTNGKTTIATLLYNLFTKAGYKVGLLSTVKVMVADTEYPTIHTTPDSITINSYLKMMNEEGVEYCFMEVSSHGIAQKRTFALQFAGGIFTNLSHDHLDYHKDFADYRNVKKSFFDHLPAAAFALVNVDDKNGLVMLQNTKAKKYTYDLKIYADYSANILENQFGSLL